jgi:hypothetical protein
MITSWAFLYNRRIAPHAAFVLRISSTLITDQNETAILSYA